MTGEKIQNILYSEDSGWFYIQTRSQLFSLRLGSFKRDDDEPDLSEVAGLDTRYCAQQILDIYSDDQWLYILLENQLVIAHGPGFIDSNGVVSLDINITSQTDYDPNFFLSDQLYKVAVNSQGLSEKQKR